MSVTVIQGEQRGDEGKGRFVDELAAEADIVARYNGGNNAGHTVVTEDGLEIDLHGIPSGITRPDTMNIIGRGCLVNAVSLGNEMEKIRSLGFEISPDNLRLSSAATLILPHHISMDEIREAGNGAQGSTKSGIAPTAADKGMRAGLRAEVINNDRRRLYTTIVDLLTSHQAERIEVGLDPVDPQKAAEEYVEQAGQLADYITDTDIYLNRRLRSGDNTHVVAEGAQGFWLDMHHGMWPYVTSSSTTAGGVTDGLGVPGRFVDKIIGVSKLMPSHVGGGPFVTEIHDETYLEDLHGDMSSVDAEKGTTTGRRRRLGHLDIPAIRRAQMVTGTSEMVVTKLDWIPRYGELIKVCVAYRRKGKHLAISPDAAYKLEESEPIYHELPNWQEDVSGAREFNELPQEAQDYIEFIEGQTGVPITMIGVGPQRDQIIRRAY